MKPTDVMPMNLIKTALDYSFTEKSNHVILLGEWCLKNEESVLSTRQNFESVPYHWNDQSKYQRDYIYLDLLYENLLIELSQDLNHIHQLNHDIRYWRIIIGPWLKFFIDILFDRYECVKTAKNVKENFSSVLYSYDLGDWCHLKFSDFWDDLESDEWNEVIFSECLREQCIPCKSDNKKISRKKAQPFDSSNMFRNASLFILDKYSKIIGPRLNGSILIGTYIPLIQSIKIQLSLHQLPYIKTPKIRFANTRNNMEKRDKILEDFIPKSNFENFCSRMIKALMPKIYLEDFKKSKESVMNSLPANPQSIFTANSYYDDVFKIWAAEKVAQNIPLIIAQHGGSFGVSLLNQSESHQRKISDKFISWGWKSNLDTNVIKLPSLQLSSMPKVFSNPNGSILLVLSCSHRYFYQYFSVPVADQALVYLENQIAFLNAINKQQLSNISIRLDKSANKNSWNTAKILEEGGYLEYISSSRNKLFDDLKKCRLCVCTQNTTVFLETLALNFPTIIYWDPSHNKIRPDAVPFFDLLHEVGILYYCPKEAAEMVNTISINVDDWWFSNEVQSVRINFCKKYALSSDKWLHAWSSFLKEQK